MESVEEIITFDYIREVYVAEKNETKLSKLPEKFFRKVNNYLKLKEEIAKNTNDEKVKYELKNAKKMVDEIILLRLKKIIDAVFIFLKTGNIPNNMIDREEEIFFKIIDLVKDLKKNLFEEEKIVKTNEINTEIDKKGVEDLLNKEKDREEISIQTNNIKIKILVDIPKFVGPDGNFYGPFEKNSIVEIEKTIATFLIDAGFALQIF